MIIALAQLKMTSSGIKNMYHTIDAIEEAFMNGADMIIFPEVQLSPFFAQYEKQDASLYLLNEEHVYIKEICEACKKYGIYAACNFYIEDNGKPYDRSLLIDDHGEIIGRQDMVHIGQYEHFYEQDYYTPGDGFHVFDTKFGKIGIVVCFDRHIPQSIQSEAVMGADLIVIPVANNIDEPLDMFDYELRTQAFENTVNIAMCNRTGIEGDMVFGGESLVVDAQGKLVYKTGRREGIYTVTIDISKTAEQRKQRGYLDLRRKELYK